MIIFVFRCVVIFRWGTHLYMSLFPSVCPSVRRAPYPRNRTSCGHNFWCTCKMMIYLCAFFVFSVFFKFWFFLVVRRIKAQEIAQNEKKKLHPSRAVSQEQCSIWSWFLVHLRKMMKPPGSKRPKIINGPKWPKIMSVTFHISVEAGGRGGFLGHMLKSRRSPFFLLHF